MSPSAERLRDWMIALQHGDRSALRPLFDAVQGPMRRFAAKLLPGPDADDAAQAALLRLFEEHARYDPGKGEVLSWALTLTAWECRTLARRRQRERARADPAEAPADEQSPLTLSLARERVLAAAAALDELSEDDRAALARALAEGPLSPTDRKRKQRALGRLRAALRARLG